MQIVRDTYYLITVREARKVMAMTVNSDLLAVLSNKFITVVVDPANGGTVSHIGRNKSPTSNVLAWYEWNYPEPLSLEFKENESADHWRSRYRGGWQFLTPNAGKECVFQGIRHSFHGASSYMPWIITNKEDETLTLEISILGLFQITRLFTIDSLKARLICNTTILNLTNSHQEIVLVEHVAFQGSPSIKVGAPDKSEWKFDGDYKEDGREIRIWSELGNCGEDLVNPVVGKTERMTYLIGGNEGWVSIFDTEKGVGAQLTWDQVDLPYIWYWQEQGSQGFPFYGRAEITALEPASCHPSDGLDGASSAGRTKVIAPGADYSFSICLDLLSND
jgi:hypothetical protein